MQLPIQSIDELRVAGRDAAQAGHGIDSSPYPSDSEHHAHWVVGFYWAQQSVQGELPPCPFGGA